jgi:formylglycine-generating enzyme required for sulfatase activity
VPGGSDDVRAKSDECLKLADGYWNQAQAATGRAKDGLLVRAGFWYGHVEWNESAMVNARITKRLEEIRSARRLPGGGGAKPGDVITNSIGMKLAFIPTGDFWMGASREQIQWAVGQAQGHYGASVRDLIVECVPREGPPRRVAIRVPFHIGVFEVTQSEFQKVMRGAGAAQQPARADSARLPVASVSWNGAVEFCRRLSSLPEEQAARREYRLPTEAEWECACLAGLTVAEPSRASGFSDAWYGSNSDRTTHPGGQRRPNAWGLCDMLGNVSEWCHNTYDANYFAQFPTAGDSRPNAPRTARGGSFRDVSVACRPSFRSKTDPSARTPEIGFRVVCTVK